MDDKHLQEVRVLSAVWTAIAIPTTFLRWRIRFSRSLSCRSLVDRSLIYEIFTLLAVCSQIVQLVIFYLPESKWGPERSYVRLITFYVIVWSTRISLLSLFVVSTAGQPLPWFKRQFLIMILIYTLIMISLIIQMMVVCHYRTGWQEEEMPQCPLGAQIAISHYVADGIADVLLFYKIFSLLWLLHGADKWRMIGSFISYVAIIVASIIHATFILKGEKTQEVIAGIIECGICILAANFPFVVAYFYRCFSSPNVGDISRMTESSVSFAAPRGESIELNDVSSPQLSPASPSTPGHLAPPSPASTAPSSTTSLIPHKR